MAKKARWENEEMTGANPFLALKKASDTASSDVTPETVTPKVETAPSKLPKAKSARIERAHRGGKTVTVVYFHGTPDEDSRSAWLKKAKSTLGIGGGVEDDHVFLQGEQVERLKACGMLP